MTKAAKSATNAAAATLGNAAAAVPTPAADVASCLRRIATAHDSCPFEE